MNDTTRLRPREHGAYAMLTFPVLSGLLLGGVSWPGAAFAVMVGAGFLGHESVLLVLGGRGERLRAAHRPAARARLLRLGLVGAAAAAVFAGSAPDGAWVPAALTALLGAVVAGILLAGRTRSLGGELLVAAAFASAHGPVAASGGAGGAAVYLPVAAWTVSFALATLAVHSMKYRFKGRGPGRWTVAAAPAAALGAMLAGAAAVAAALPWWAGAASLFPKALVVLVLAVLTLHPRNLKRVGWTLVAADTLTLVLLAALAG
ncbi:MAG: YwiC-like family protein [Longimicrobiales bacterium]|nr:YwiC-like family protein [Longimicrobiales bacterium]